jgi:hypothetical protein
MYDYVCGYIKPSAYALVTASVERVGVARFTILLEFISTLPEVKFVDAIEFRVELEGSPPDPELARTYARVATSWGFVGSAQLVIRWEFMDREEVGAVIALSVVVFR